jgi:hypothetical protein
MKMVIKVHEKSLSDGSKVFDVQVGETMFPAVTEKDAYVFANTVYHAIRDYTNEHAMLCH